jgi:hypothetical protein
MTTTLIIVEVLGIAAMALFAIYLATRMIGAARKKPAGAGAVGWALLFLSFGRMPPPPPASQIELEVDSKKDRLASRDIGDP